MSEIGRRDDEDTHTQFKILRPMSVAGEWEAAFRDVDGAEYALPVVGWALVSVAFIGLRTKRLHARYRAVEPLVWSDDGMSERGAAGGIKAAGEDGNYLGVRRVQS